MHQVKLPGMLPAQSGNDYDFNITAVQAFAEKPKGKALDDWQVDTTVLGELRLILLLEAQLCGNSWNSADIIIGQWQSLAAQTHNRMRRVID